MKSLLGLVIVAVLVFGAVPASAGEPTQVWRCEMEDGVSEEDVEAMAAAWLKAAKTVPGGANFKASVFFPVAVNLVDDTDVWFVVTAPSFAEWGKFWDNYGDSAAGDIEDQHKEKIVCPDSALWESIKVQ